MILKLGLACIDLEIALEDEAHKCILFEFLQGSDIWGCHEETLQRQRPHHCDLISSPPPFLYIHAIPSLLAYAIRSH